MAANGKQPVAAEILVEGDYDHYGRLIGARAYRDGLPLSGTLVMELGDGVVRRAEFVDGKWVPPAIDSDGTEFFPAGDGD